MVAESPNTPEAGASLGSRHRTSLFYGLWVLGLVLFWAVGEVALRGYVLDLGSIFLPMPLHVAFLAVWSLFGMAASLALSAALCDAGASPFRSRIERWLVGSRDTNRWLVYGTGLAFLIPLSIRLLILKDAPLTDDESSYRFMAELLAQGRLFADSPELKLFFDRGQMINDGRLYAQYFIGWPALMVPGVWLGYTGLMNPLYAALTVLPLWRLADSVAGPVAARLALLLYLGSPFLMIGAATDLAHTSCLMLLTWTAWFFACGRRTAAERGVLWSDSALALAFSAAFFVRPQSALPLALPWLLAWAFDRLRDPAARLRRLLAFAVPALAMASLFLVVNHVQTGSASNVAYQRAHDYAAENEGRFASDAQTWNVEVSHLQLDRGPVEMAGHLGIGLFRSNFAVFGWPLSFFFLFFAAWNRRTRLWWLSLLSFLFFHLPTSDAGIDSFGPVHYFELTLPVLLLSCFGIRQLGERLAGVSESWGRWPAALAVAFVITAWLGYGPVRLMNLERMAENINLPLNTVREAGLGRAIVFSPWPFAPNCLSRPTQHHVRFRPNNDPDLKNDILWVNHLDVETNKQLMRLYPDRQGFVMLWSQDCKVVLAPLDQLQPGQVPPGRQRKEN